MFYVLAECALLNQGRRLVSQIRAHLQNSSGEVRGAEATQVPAAAR